MTPTPNRPAIKRSAFHCWLAPSGTDPDECTDEQLTYHHVVVRNGDQLRAELEAPRLKIDARKHPFHLTNLWLWAALVRTEDFDGTFREFTAQLVSYDPDRDRDEPHTDPDADGDELDARPTAASTS